VLNFSRQYSRKSSMTLLLVCGEALASPLEVGTISLYKYPLQLHSGASVYGHRGSCKDAGQLRLYKNGVFKRLCDRNVHFMAKKHARCAKCAYLFDRVDFRDPSATNTSDGAADGTPPLQGS
jgi:hypothetical protein